MLGASILVLLIAAVAYAVTSLGGLITLALIGTLLFLAYQRLSLLAFSLSVTVLLAIYTFLGQAQGVWGIWKGLLWLGLAGLWLLTSAACARRSSPARS